MAQAGFEEFDDARDHSGPEPPQRSRRASATSKGGKNRPKRGAVKPKSNKGIHNRRNKRMGW